GTNWPAPPNERSARSRLLKPGRQAVGSVVSLVALARQDVYSWRINQLDALRTAWATLVFAGPATGSSLSSFSALTQSSTSFPCSPPRCPASDLFSRWFSVSNYCNLLGCPGQGNFG